VPTGIREPGGTLAPQARGGHHGWVDHGPLTAFDLERLRRRRSIKWRRYAEDVLPLWVAEMDTPLAPPIRDALATAVELGDTGYAHRDRLPQAFAGFAAARYGWWPDPARMWLVPDVMQGIVEVLRLVTARGDGVVVNTPAYPPFFPYLADAERRVVESPLTVDATGRYGLDLDRLAADFAAPGVTAYLLANPHNPTGLVLGVPDLLAVTDLAARYGVRVLADEIHAPLTYPGVVYPPYLSLPGTESAVAFASATKAWNLAGLKAGLAIAGDSAAADLARMPEGVAFGAGLFGVLASEAAFQAGTAWLDALLTDLDANRWLLGDLLATELPEVGYHPPDSTFLAWLDCRRLELGDDPSAAFLERGRVAVNPGPSFGPPGRGHVRLNFATSPAILADGVRRMATAVKR
jgi:cystathionine beta-lyase